ncbi:hypothetical protein KCP70_02830 [Salmonella enterica subsp. enterica]|nr:hypothetical protein KCP70_02830 [Salmonella enterica subsp. enterica]
MHLGNNAARYGPNGGRPVNATAWREGRWPMNGIDGRYHSWLVELWKLAKSSACF